MEEALLMIGKTLGHYQISSQLGKGGMGEAYCARDSFIFLSLGTSHPLKPVSLGTSHPLKPVSLGTSHPFTF